MSIVLERLYEDFITNNKINKKFKETLIFLIHKNGSKLDLDNYRPISLINCDLKIISLVINQRLKLKISSLIKSNQIGFIPRKRITNNINIVKNILKFNSLNLINEGYIFFIDFRKAYDSISWDFMIKSLKRFPIDETFRKYITNCYRGAQSRILFGKYITNKINLRKGIRQGDNISPLIFNLCLEPFLLAIESLC